MSKGKNTDIYYHSFPLDDRKQIWMDFCSIFKEFTGLRHICSLHFSKDCYAVYRVNGDGKVELKLKNDAIPTIKFPRKDNPEPGSSLEVDDKVIGEEFSVDVVQEEVVKDDENFIVM